VAIVRDPSLAEDLTTETFWRIYRAHARFDPARSFAERIAKLLKKSHPRVTDDGTRLGRDLWPAMLQRLQQPAAPVAWFEQAWFNQAWFDWALGAAVVAWLAFFPAAIPVLLYHL
jgi:DNA-directed RNA polymerase specialized sigma24 family protein